MKIISVISLFAILLAVVIYMSGGSYDQPGVKNKQGHVFDKAGIINASDATKFEWLLDLIEKESDLDIKFLFLKTIGDETIEEVAVKKMDDYGIGRDGREERGVLFLYVMDDKRLRIEVGYGLEAYLPDSFVGYLIRNQADAFFNAANPSLGLRLLIRILHHRIREAVLDRDYDPAILEGGYAFSYLSGGAGAAGNVGVEYSGQTFKHDQLTEEERGRFTASESVYGTFNNYIQWLYGRKNDPNVGIFTKGSRSAIKSFPMTPAYFDYILLLYAGKQYEVATQGDLAILYFIDDPLISPLFLRETDGLWRLDLRAEVRNTRNHVGGVYNWSFNPDSKDQFAQAFSHLIINLRGYYRLQNGDNRELPVKVDVQE